MRGIGGCLVVVGMVAAVGRAAAQSRLVDLRPGMTIRATVADRSTPLVGALAGLEAGRIDLVTDRGLTGLDVETVVRLERRTGWSSRIVAGTLVGAAVGVAATLWFTSGTGLCSESGSGCVLKAGLLTGVPPTLLGMIVGANIRTERWADVSLAPRVGGAPNAVGLGLRISF